MDCTEKFFPLIRPEESVDDYVLLTARDLGALDYLVHYEMAADHPVRPLLLHKLHCARVCDDLPPDVVTINARVLFRIGVANQVEQPAGKEMRILVLPSRYVANGLCLSLISPLGAAMLGMSSGTEAEYHDFCGRRLWVAVDEVLYQPPPRRKPSREPLDREARP